MSELRPDDTIAGRYRLLRELGSGGAGVVFRARDEDEGRDVAIKVLRISTPRAARRLRREARAALTLDPERVARVYEVGELPDGRAYLVMEYVPGRTLRALLGSGDLARPEALRILREIAITLGAAHRAGLVHRDVKPDNVVIGETGRVVLLDFGIVKFVPVAEGGAPLTTQLTTEGDIIGTPAYLAPEQARSDEVTPAVDQFALGVVAYKLLTGALPWTETDLTRMLAQVLAASVPPPSTRNPSLPKLYDAVLGRALARSPHARFPTIEAFVDALEAAEQGVALAAPADLGVEEAAPPPPIGSRRPRSYGAVLAALVVVLSLAGGGVALRERSRHAHDPAPPIARSAMLAVSDETPLACPIFDVEGAPDAPPRLAAAAAALACVRAKWYLGGSDNRILLPAALLGAPVVPEEELWSFYDRPGLRDQTMSVAHARGLPTLEGKVERTAGGWLVDLVARAADGRAVAQVSGISDPYFEPAIRSAVTALWRTPPLTPAAIDPDVARWTSYPDVAAGLLELDLTQADTQDACATVRDRGAALGAAYYDLLALCPDSTPTIDAGAVVLDESSPSALARSVNVLVTLAPANPFSEAETRRLALELESMRRAETSRFRRATLARVAGLLWSLLPDADHALTDILATVADDPLLANAWFQLVFFARGTGSSDAALSLASVWFPQEPQFQRPLAARTDELDSRILEGQLGYLLEPTVERTAILGAALAEAGRIAEVQTLIGVTPIGGAAPNARLAELLRGYIDLREGRLASALGRFEGVGGDGMRLMPALVDVLGTAAPADRWATKLLDSADASDVGDALDDPASGALCMRAERARAARCLARIEKVAGGPPLSWGVGGDRFLAGAIRFAGGDMRGAAEAWRPLVAGPNDRLAAVIPTEAFDRAGEPDLAARLDARKMGFRQIAGLSEAAPREARRAFSRGDRARAKELARAVVDAWGDPRRTDAVVPSVADMRDLLAKLPD